MATQMTVIEAQQRIATLATAIDWLRRVMPEGQRNFQESEYAEFFAPSSMLTPLTDLLRTRIAEKDTLQKALGAVAVIIE